MPLKIVSTKEKGIRYILRVPEEDAAIVLEEPNLIPPRHSG
jgi:predicted transcriptional regulator